MEPGLAIRQGYPKNIMVEVSDRLLNLVNFEPDVSIVEIAWTGGVRSRALSRLNDEGLGSVYVPAAILFFPESGSGVAPLDLGSDNERRRDASATLSSR